MTESEVPSADPTNTESARAWNGDEGQYWAAHDRRFDHGISRFHRPLLEAAAVDRDAAVVDIGCGTGQLTRDAAQRAPSGSALGLDLSLPMLAVARRRAEDEGVTNARFVAADAQIHPFESGRFDIVVSRAGVMFFGDPVAAFTNIWAALRPHGRMTLLVWQARELNTWVVAFAEALAAGRPVPVPPRGAPSPFAFAEPDDARAVLEMSGFRDVAFTSVEEPMDFGTDADDAFEFVRGMGFTQFMLRDLDGPAQDRALTALRATIDAHATDAGVLFPAAAWIITARNAAS